MLTVGQVAARAGVKVDTVRYYERRGVLPTAPRRRSGYRSFPPEAVARIAFAKEMQALGFRLEEIIGLLRLGDGGAATCGNAGPAVRATLERVNGKIVALTAMRDQLLGLTRRCAAERCAFEPPRC